MAFDAGWWRILPGAIRRAELCVLHANWCDVVPTHVGHILLGHPWKFDKKVTHDGFKNIYALVLNNHTIVLTPLRPTEAYANQIKIVRECKLRKEQLSIQEKERNSNQERRNDEDIGEGVMEGTQRPRIGKINEKNKSQES